MPKLKRSLFALALALILSIQSTSNVMASMSNDTGQFVYKYDFDDIKFDDVTQSDWFYDYIREVYQFGLMVGHSARTFNPDGYVKISETITIASRLHSIYHTGNENFVQGTPWYRTYVEYAIKNGILLEEYSDYDAAATRAEFAVILSKALPDSALKAINQYADGDVPDVSLSDRYGEAVYRLYKAGILIGNDEKGTFSPHSTIRRSEVAAIVSRMANPQMRLAKTPVPPKDTGAVPEIGTTEPTFVVETVEAAGGEKSVPVRVMLKNNPGIASIALLVSYDSSLTLSSVVYNEEAGFQTIEPQKMANPMKLLWISPFEDVNGDWTLATLYFDVDADAGAGEKQIVIRYDADDVFNISEENVAFGTLNGSISVIQ